MSAEKYRRQAKQWFRTAERVTDPATRIGLMELAQSWLVLSEQAEKNLAADVVYETPPSHDEAGGSPGDAAATANSGGEVASTRTRFRISPLF
jgi:hypothetical protein